MTEQLISFKTAKAAKLAGFETHIAHFNAAYNTEGKFYPAVQIANSPNLCKEYGFQVVTQSLLQKWLREEKKVSVEVNAVDTWEEWIARVYGEDSMSPFFLYKVTDGAETYEAALEQGLLAGLELLNG